VSHDPHPLERESGALVGHILLAVDAVRRPQEHRHPSLQLPGLRGLAVSVAVARGSEVVSSAAMGPGGPGSECD
jgi:hypothetical protein